MNFANGAVAAAEYYKGNVGHIVGPAQDRGVLECATDSLANTLSELSSAIDVLEGRLTSVLQPSAPSEQSAANTVGSATPISPAVGYLVEQRRRIDAMVLRVNDIRTRLDS